MIQHYISEEKQLEKLTGYKHHYNIFERFLIEHKGEAVTLLMHDGASIPIILISGSEKLLAVRRFSEAERLIIPSRNIIGIATS